MLALLAKDAEGYANLMRLSSRAWLDSADTAEPHVPLALLEALSAGLICLTGGPAGPVEPGVVEGQAALARSRLARLAAIFERAVLCRAAAPWPDRRGTGRSRPDRPRLCARPAARRHQRALFRHAARIIAAHDALICIAEGEVIAAENRRRLTPDHYFKAGSEMAALFADLPEAIDNTVEIARRCAFRPLPRAPILPRF